MSTRDDDRWGLDEGDRVAPHLGVLRRLGGGSRYEAYLAWDDRLLSTVVVKVLRPSRAEDPRAIAGLEAEFRALEALNHPVILRKFGGVLDGPRPHVVVEHLEGPRLSSLVRRYGPLTADQLVPLGIQLGAALHYMHNEAGLLHLDVKPSNIIMGAPARMIDLSIARSVERAKELTRPIGTDGYMAPEQCLPRELGPPGPAADVWGLCATLYRAHVGGSAFSPPGDSTVEPEERWPQLTEDPLPLAEGLAPATSEAILAGLSRDPDSRPAPAELVEALEQTLEVLPRPSIGKLKPRRRR